MSVQQSGSITPGHAAIWGTDGVIRDGGSLPLGPRVIASLLGADFNSTLDQALVFPQFLVSVRVTSILVTNASISLTTAVGGIYPNINKTGTAVVANTQVYSALTDPTRCTDLTLTANNNAKRYIRSNVPNWAFYLSLTTPQGAPATADVYVIGVELLR